MISALPATHTATRAELHRLAEEILKPAREEVTGRFGLRALPGGFGTAPYGDVLQLHFDGTYLVRRDGCRGARRCRAPRIAESAARGEIRVPFKLTNSAGSPSGTRPSRSLTHSSEDGADERVQRDLAVRVALA